MKDIYRIHGTGRSLVLIVSLTLLVGCASRGYVRSEVGERADQLAVEIEQNQQGLSQVQERTEAVQDEVELQAGRLDEAFTALDLTRSELNETRTVAERSLQTAETAGQLAQTNDDRTRALEERFSSRNQLDVRAVHQVSFDFDSAQLRPEFDDVLEAVGRDAEGEEGAIVVLEGYTDSIGAADYNRQLAERRIEAVKRRLVVDLGFPVYRIHTFSFGEERPLGENDGNAESQRIVRLTVLASVAETAVSGLND